MQTPEFTRALHKLIDLGEEKPTAILCAEAVPCRCHRSLIGDALAVRGVEVRDIFTPARAEVHTLTPMAKIQGIRITYPT